MNVFSLKKTLAFLLLFSMLCVLLTACTTPENNQNGESEKTDASDAQTTVEETTEAEETSNEEETTSMDSEVTSKKTLDIYLIAGQSNATGYSKISSFTKAFEWAPELQSGYSNVFYAGNSRSNGAEPRDRVIDWKKTTLRLGANSQLFGPEAGMAEALSAYYNEESGRYAGIIKYAFGGSSLLNATTGDTAKDGNWVSPSYQKTLPAGQIVAGVTGQMYRNFLAQVEKNLGEVFEGNRFMEYYGFDSIRICGIYWMQGCSNKSNPTEYDVAFRYFAKDVRADVAAIVKRMTGSNDDCGAADMPIIVGTISQTQNLTSASTESVNKTFIAMQKSFATKISNCYVVDNSAFPITKWENNKQVIVGSDQWHWNQADMLTIGKNVGDAMLYCAGYTETDPGVN